jgi:hypothetical protein
MIDALTVARPVWKSGVLNCSRDLRSSGILCSVDWYLVTDVSGQIIGPIFKGQAVKVDGGNT